MIKRLILYTSLYLLVAYCFTGCMPHREGPERHVNTISSGPGDISLSDHPSDVNPDPTQWKMVEYYGHITMVPVIFKMDVQPYARIAVYVKETPDGAWQQIFAPDHVGETTPMFTYRPDTQQLTFQNCYQGWGYTVFVFNPFQQGILQ